MEVLNVVGDCMSYYPEWYRKQREAMMVRFGNSCLFCGAKEQLEFAHTDKTGVMGLGRGSYWRITDVKRFTNCYILLCRSCHLSFDRFRANIGVNVCQFDDDLDS